MTCGKQAETETVADDRDVKGNGIEPTFGDVEPFLE